MPSDGGTYEVRNPATGAKIADVAEATREDLNDAVGAARRAFDAGKWASMAASRRAKIVYKIAQLIGERAARLGVMRGSQQRQNRRDRYKGELGAIVDCF